MQAAASVRPNLVELARHSVSPTWSRLASPSDGVPRGKLAAQPTLAARDMRGGRGTCEVRVARGRLLRRCAVFRPGLPGARRRLPAMPTTGSAMSASNRLARRRRQDSVARRTRDYCVEGVVGFHEPSTLPAWLHAIQASARVRSCVGRRCVPRRALPPRPPGSGVLRRARFGFGRAAGAE